MTTATAIYIYQYEKVVLNGNYFFLFTLFAVDALQFIFVVNVLQSVLFYFYKIKYHTPPPEKFFYLKNEMIMCASWRGGASSKRNCMGTSNA